MTTKSPLSALPLNKTAQFLFGLLILFVAVKLWWAGWFSVQLFGLAGETPETDGMGNPVGLLPFVLDSVCLVGVFGFWAIQFLRNLVGPLWGMAQAKAAGLLDKDDAATEPPIVNAKPKPVDPSKIGPVLEELSQRLMRIEDGHPELMPKPEPTKEELLAELEELKAKQK